MSKPFGLPLADLLPAGVVDTWMASVLLPRPYTHVSNNKPTTQQCLAKSPSSREQSDTIGESARNRFGRPYISGRPLLVCDRRRIVQLYQQGVRKIAIARQIGITHSCVSKVIRRFEESGDVENKTGRTASCACPGESVNHDTRVCRHLKYHPVATNNQEPVDQAPNSLVPFSVEWILSEQCPPPACDPSSK